MTKKKLHTRQNTLLPVFLIIATLYFAIGISPEINNVVKEGLEVALFTVVPTAFPFMIVSDIYTAYGYPERIRILSVLFEKMSGIPKYGIKAFICGNISGFPIGAKIASELYTGGAIDKKSAEKLCAISNNASIPFTIGAVGAGVFGDKKIGLLLLMSTYISCVFTMLIYREKTSPCESYRMPFAPAFDPVSSIKRAGGASVNIVFFITAFFALNATVGYIIKIDEFSLICAVITEITSAVKLISSSCLSLRIKLSIASFALSFGTISILMQSMQFMKPAGLKFQSYLYIKLIQGLFSSIITYIIYPIIYILL